MAYIKVNINAQTLAVSVFWICVYVCECGFFIFNSLTSIALCSCLKAKSVASYIILFSVTIFKWNSNYFWPVSVTCSWETFKQTSTCVANKNLNYQEVYSYICYVFLTCPKYAASYLSGSSLSTEWGK